MVLQETNTISITNNGAGVPVEIHKEEGIYVPELIFGHLLTSSNYDDSQKKASLTAAVCPTFFVHHRPQAAANA